MFEIMMFLLWTLGAVIISFWLMIAIICGRIGWHIAMATYRETVDAYKRTGLNG